MIETQSERGPTGVMMKILGLLFALFTMYWPAAPCFGEPLEYEGREVKTVTGTVKEIDFVGYQMTIAIYGGTMTLTVPEDIKIMRGSEQIFFVDIKIDDPVTVDFIESAPGIFQVVSMTDNNLGLGSGTPGTGYSGF